MRKIGGVIAGIAVFIVILTTLEFVGRQIFGVAPGRPMPAGMLAFVAVAYFLAALGGGYMAGRIVGERWAAWLIAILVAAGAAYSLTAQHPLWMQVASIVAPLLGGLVASRTVVPARSMEADAAL